VLASQLLSACGAPLADAQLAWCLDTTPNGTKEVVAYPEGLGGGGLAATFDRMQAWENSWRAEHPGEPLPTKTVPDETTSNAFVNTARKLTPWHRLKIDPPGRVLVTLCCRLALSLGRGL